MLVQGVHILNPVLPLRNNSYLSSLDFISTTNLYGWNLNGTSSQDMTAWIGGNNLTASGSWITGTDNLGNTTYNDPNSTWAYVNSSALDDTGSFTVCGWVKPHAHTNNTYLFGKYGDAANASFYLGVEDSATHWTFYVYYNGSSGQINLPIPVGSIPLNTWSHIACVYNQASTSMMIIVNGIVVGYKVDANLSARNNGTTAKFTLGALTNAGSGALNCQITDFIYSKSALSLAQIRRLYVVGTLLSAYTDENGKTKINGENLGDYWISYPLSTSGSTGWSASYAAGIPFIESGIPRLRFDIKATFSSSGQISTTIANVVFKSSLLQPILFAGYADAVAMEWSWTGGGDGTFYTRWSGNNTQATWKGNLILNAFPSWALDLSTLY